MAPRTALIVVDVQNDFCEGGALAVAGGDEVARMISLDLISQRKYDVFGLSKDWHIDPGPHWSKTPDYVDSWPVHCEANTVGAKLNIVLVASIYVEFADQLANLLYQVSVFQKGQFAASYSAVEGFDHYGINLVTWLNEHDITNVHVVGLAFDYCVKATAIDLVKEGFNVTLLKKYTASVNPANDAQNITDLTNAGVVVDF